MRRLLILFITYYQRYLSPYKGFRCAYAVRYGGASCSSKVKEIIVANQISQGICLIRQQFRGCKQAFEWLQEHSKARDNLWDQGNDQNTSTYACCANLTADVIPLPCDCGACSCVF